MGFFDDPVGSIEDTVEDAVDTVEDTGEDIVEAGEDVVSGGQEAAEEVVEGGKDVVDEVSEGDVGGAVDEAVETGGEVGDTVTDTAGDVVSGDADTGSDAFSGGSSDSGGSGGTDFSPEPSGGGGSTRDTTPQDSTTGGTRQPSRPQNAQNIPDNTADNTGGNRERVNRTEIRNAASDSTFITGSGQRINKTQALNILEDRRERRRRRSQRNNQPDVTQFEDLSPLNQFLAETNTLLSPRGADLIASELTGNQEKTRELVEEQFAITQDRNLGGKLKEGNISEAAGELPGLGEEAIKSPPGIFATGAAGGAAFGATTGALSASGATGTSAAATGLQIGGAGLGAKIAVDETTESKDLFEQGKEEEAIGNLIETGAGFAGFAKGAGIGRRATTPKVQDTTLVNQRTELEPLTQKSPSDSLIGRGDFKAETNIKNPRLLRLLGKPKTEKVKTNAEFGVESTGGTTEAQGRLETVLPSGKSRVQDFQSLSRKTGEGTTPSGDKFFNTRDIFRTETEGRLFKRSNTETGKGRTIVENRQPLDRIVESQDGIVQSRDVNAELINTLSTGRGGKSEVFGEGSTIIRGRKNGGSSGGAGSKGRTKGSGSGGQKQSLEVIGFRESGGVARTDLIESNVQNLLQPSGRTISGISGGSGAEGATGDLPEGLDQVQETGDGQGEVFLLDEQQQQTSPGQDQIVESRDLDAVEKLVGQGKSGRTKLGETGGQETKDELDPVSDVFIRDQTDTSQDTGQGLDVSGLLKQGQDQEQGQEPEQEQLPFIEEIVVQENEQRLGQSLEQTTRQQPGIELFKIFESRRTAPPPRTPFSIPGLTSGAEDQGSSFSELFGREQDRDIQRSVGADLLNLPGRELDTVGETSPLSLRPIEEENGEEELKLF